MTGGSHATWEEAVGSLLRDPSQRQLVLDCFYDQPRSAAAERYARSPEWRAALELLPKSAGKALEIGAGHGIASCALARAGWNVTALEPDPSPLVGAGAIRTLAKECRLDIRVVEAFAEQLPFGDGEFDLVLARQVLHHARDLPQLGREIARVLKPGGTLLAMREHVISQPADLPRFLAATRCIISMEASTRSSSASIARHSPARVCASCARSPRSIRRSTSRRTRARPCGRRSCAGPRGFPVPGRC